MLRISKLADYACLMMRHLSLHQDGFSAGEIALKTHIQLPTVRKLLKILTRAGLLSASRGVQGGYQLAKPFSEINVLQIVEAVDGPIALVDCAHAEKNCEISAHCSTQANWLQINRVVKDALAHMSLRNI